VFIKTMERDPGWTVGAPGDDAVTGQWELVMPWGSVVDGHQCAPNLDHTAAGGFCWITGQPTGPQDSPGAYDVDGGKTSLITNLFDATAGSHPVIEYYRWYTNRLGNDPSNDWWRTYISNDDGASWKPVENTEQSNEAWQRVVFFIEDAVQPTRFMRMKFVAQDSAAGSLVEAGIDDFRLLSFFTDAVPTPVGTSGALALAPPSPNPAAWRTNLRFTLPEARAITLRVFDVSGRALRTLAAGRFGAGGHTISWDGRDDQGRRVAPGPYFVRLADGTRDLARKLTLVR